MIDFVLSLFFFFSHETAVFNPGIVNFPVVFGRLDMFNKLPSAGLALKRCNILILFTQKSFSGEKDKDHKTNPFLH